MKSNEERILETLLYTFEYKSEIYIQNIINKNEIIKTEKKGFCILFEIIF